MLGMDAARWEEAGEPGGTGTEPADHHSLEAFPNLNDCGILKFPVAPWPRGPNASRDASRPQNAAGPEVTWGKSHFDPLIPHFFFNFGSSESLQ